MKEKIKQLMIKGGFALANGYDLKAYTNEEEVLNYLDRVAWVCLQNDFLSIAMK